MRQLCNKEMALCDLAVMVKYSNYYNGTLRRITIVDDISDMHKSFQPCKFSHRGRHEHIEHVNATWADPLLPYIAAYLVSLQMALRCVT